MLGLLITLTLGLLVAPLAAEAQPAGKMVGIGILQVGTASGTAGPMEGFQQGLRDLG
jgi:hypothetical protein